MKNQPFNWPSEKTANNVLASLSGLWSAAVAWQVVILQGDCIGLFDPVNRGCLSPFIHFSYKLRALLKERYTLRKGLQRV